MKKITVITICFNEEKTIRRTIESVLNQTYSDFEYIIKDGNSTDRSNEIIEIYQSQFDKRGIRFVHLVGNDKGIYDAMNIALKESAGEWVNFMNAGDSFFNEYVLEDIFQNRIWKGQGVLYGHTLCELEKGYKFVQINNHNNLVKGVGISQQVCFVRKNIFDEIPLKIEYRILADYDFLLHAQDANITFKQLNMIIANYNRRGISSKAVYETSLERIDILKQYGGKKSITLFTGITLKIKTLFSKSFPLLSDFLFCKHVSKSM